MENCFKIQHFIHISKHCILFKGSHVSTYCLLFQDSDVIHVTMLCICFKIQTFHSHLHTLHIVSRFKMFFIYVSTHCKFFQDSDSSFTFHHVAFLFHIREISLNFNTLNIISKFWCFFHFSYCFKIQNLHLLFNTLHFDSRLRCIHSCFST